MPSSPWRRRRTTDSPRPAGRLAGRLRRSGSFARRMLVGVAPRRDERASRMTTTVVLPTTPDAEQRPYSARGRRRRLYRAGPAPYPPERTGRVGAAERVAPVSPPVNGPVVAPLPGPLSIPLLPGERTVARRVKFAVVNGFTVASLLLGMVAIFAGMQGDPRLGGLCLVGCVLFDGIDGALARRFGVASPFGAQMDSLADMCSFGIAAPVVVYAMLHGSAPLLATGAVCAMVAACAAIRLARFNVSPCDGRYFCGVPTTMAAAVLGVAAVLGLRPSGLLALGAVALLAVAMVSSFPYAKLARLAKLPPWLWLLPVLGALLDYRVTFALVVLAYLVSGPLLWLRQRSIA